MRAFDFLSLTLLQYFYDKFQHKKVNAPVYVMTVTHICNHSLCSPSFFIFLCSWYRLQWAWKVKNLQSIYSKKTSNSHAEFQPGGSHFRYYICFRLALFTHSCISIYVYIYVLSIFCKKTPRWQGIYTDTFPLLWLLIVAISLNHIKRDASHQILNS